MVKNVEKVEINIIDKGWQWLGYLKDEDLKLLCEMADILSDKAIQKVDTAPTKAKGE